MKFTEILLAVLLVIGCGSKNNPAQNEGTVDPSKAADVNFDDTINNQDRETDHFDYSECIRGVATPVVNKQMFPNAVFKLNPDNHTGIETVNLRNDEKLVISNTGCEYYVLMFRIETERFQADASNTAYWLQKSTVFMKEIESGIDAPLNIQSGIKAIVNRATTMEDSLYQVGDEIVYHQDLIREFVSLDRVQRIDDKRFAIEISFSKGPL